MSEHKSRSRPASLSTGILIYSVNIRMGEKCQIEAHPVNHQRGSRFSKTLGCGCPALHPGAVVPYRFHGKTMRPPGLSGGRTLKMYCNTSPSCLWICEKFSLSRQNDSSPPPLMTVTFRDIQYILPKHVLFFVKHQAIECLQIYL